MRHDERSVEFIDASLELDLPRRCIWPWFETRLESQIIRPRDKLASFDLLSGNNFESFCKS
jgi:hypothetical protein